MPEYDYHFETNCIASTARWINDMTDQARPITWPTFRKHVHWTRVRELFPDYSYRGEIYSPVNDELTTGFHIKDDWAVGFFKSFYRGRPCVYIQHSAIEYIFTKRGD